ncbi:8408_t:CDS:1, partial [Gigaspora rosea]
LEFDNDDLERKVNFLIYIMKNKEDSEYGPPPTSTAAAAQKSTKYSHSTLRKTDASLDPNSNPVKMVQEM